MGRKAKGKRQHGNRGQDQRKQTKGSGPRRRHMTPGEAQGWPGSRPESVGRTEAPVRLRTGTVIPAGSAVYPVSEAEKRDLGRMRDAGLAQPEGQSVRLRRPRLELPPLIRSAPGGLSGGQVLDMRTGLYEALKSPHPGLTDFYRDFVDEGARAISGAADEKLAAAWGYMLVGITSGEALLARQLHASDAVQVTAEMAAAVTETYRKSRNHVMHLDSADIPDLDGNDIAGFVWLDEPLLLDAPKGRGTLMNRAVSWCRQTAELGRETWAGVRITSWASTEDRDDLWSEATAAVMREVGTPLTVSHSVFVPFGQRFARPDAVPNTPDDIVIWAAVLWQYLKDQVAVAPRAHVERHAVKRAQRASLKTGVRVIMMRKTYYAERREAGHRDVDWSCRWTVTPFTRHKSGYRALGFAPHDAEPTGPDKHCAVCGHGTSAVKSCTKPKDRTDLPWKGQDEKLFKLAR